MDRNTSSPLLAHGGLFVGRDPRRSFMVNGSAYARQMHRKESSVSFPQAVMAGIVLACFAVGVICVAAGVS